MANTLIKQCSKCSIVQPLSGFYKHKLMSDGYLNKCKTCTKADVKNHRDNNLEHYREYDRNRANLPHRKANNHRNSKAWLAQDSRRSSCHLKVQWAIKTGKLIKQPCKRCNAIKAVAHHEDYDKPLDVIWLCQPCHKQRHKEIDAEFLAEVLSSF